MFSKVPTQTQERWVKLLTEGKEEVDEQLAKDTVRAIATHPEIGLMPEEENEKELREKLRGLIEDASIWENYEDKVAENLKERMVEIAIKEAEREKNRPSPAEIEGILEDELEVRSVRATYTKAPEEIRVKIESDEVDRVTKKDIYETLRSHYGDYDEKIEIEGDLEASDIEEVIEWIEEWADDIENVEVGLELNKGVGLHEAISQEVEDVPGDLTDDEVERVAEQVLSDAGFSPSGPDGPTEAADITPQAAEAFLGNAGNQQRQNYQSAADTSEREHRKDDPQDRTEVDVVSYIASATIRSDIDEVEEALEDRVIMDIEDEKEIDTHELARLLVTFGGRCIKNYQKVSADALFRGKNHAESMVLYQNIIEEGIHEHLKDMKEGEEGVSTANKH
jgi:hypothetical protein